jgi:multiple sugar transport system permease protein
MVTRVWPRIVSHCLLLIFATTFIAPFAWMVISSVKHESHMFPRPGEAMWRVWLPTSNKVDEQGRPVVTFTRDDKSVTATKKFLPAEDKSNEQGQFTILVNGEEVLAFPEELEEQTAVGFHFENYRKAFEQIDFVNNLKNTLFICFSVVIGTVLSCSLVAYSFARIPWRGRNTLFIFVLATMMLPTQVTLIPLFSLYKELGWTGTFKPLIVPAFFGTPFYIFLLRQFFMGIPQDLSAAARIDGCSEFGIFMRIIIPLSRPALATTALFMFLYQWSDFLNPLIYLQDDRQFTIAVALQQFQNQHEMLWGPLMAMATVVTVPIVVLFFLTQRTFIQGITMTGLKG